MEHDTDAIDKFLHVFGIHHWKVWPEWNHHEDRRTCKICGLIQSRKWQLPIDLVCTEWKPIKIEQVRD